MFSPAVRVCTHIKQSLLGVQLPEPPHVLSVQLDLSGAVILRDSAQVRGLGDDHQPTMQGKGNADLHRHRAKPNFKQIKISSSCFTSKLYMTR